jgi:hypothetical protein
VRVFKTKEFARFARREKIADVSLCEAIARAERGLIDAELSGNLIKQRVPRQGQGRSGGYRTIVAYRFADRAVFLFGFGKSDRANIDANELLQFKSAAALLLSLSEKQIGLALKRGEFLEVACDAEEV